MSGKQEASGGRLNAALQNLRPSGRRACQCKVVQRCIEALPPSAELIADNGYDGKALREWLEARGTRAVIPHHCNRKVLYDYDKAIYKQRNVIERMFCRLKDWRRIPTRFDQNIQTFISTVALAATVRFFDALSGFE
jgi:transposase